MDCVRLLLRKELMLSPEMNSFRSSRIAVCLLAAVLWHAGGSLSRLSAWQVWNSMPTAAPERHPLADADRVPGISSDPQRPSPPVNHAPHRSWVPYEPSFGEPSILGSPDLVQPPHPLNQPGGYGLDPLQMSREEFWRQFSTLPPGDKKARTEGYESLQATLKNGFWFAGLDLLYLEPTFQANNAYTSTTGSLVQTQQVDFGFDVSYRGHVGFETNAGPALKFSWWGLNNFSAINDFSIGPGRAAITTIDLGDSDTNLQLGAAASDGSRLTVQQQMKFDSMEVTFYKDQVNPVSRMRGNVAIRSLSLHQNLFAGLDDPVNGSQLIRNLNDYLGVGPKLGIEYFRPIGHTDLEFQSGMFGSLLFGRREQVLVRQGPIPLQYQQLGKVETLSIFELYLGVEWNRQLSHCRTFFLKTALESQLWAGSDSALNVGDDFGLYGMSFGFGLTH